MATVPTARNEQLEAVVRRVRRAAQAAGELDLPKGSFESPWPVGLRAVVAGIIDDGTYAAAASAVAESDPDLA